VLLIEQIINNMNNNHRGPMFMALMELIIGNPLKGNGNGMTNKIVNKLLLLKNQIE
jgi:hypothetical protein